MEIVKVPTADGCVADDWKAIAQLARVINALAGVRIIRGAARDRLSLTEANAILELAITDAASTPAETYCWEPYAAPSGGRNIMLRPGFVWDGNKLWEPSNLNAVFTVPANCTAGWYAWLDATVDPASGSISALAYDSGTTLPATQSDITDGSGNVPAHAYALLCMLTSTATSVELSVAQQFLKTPLQLSPFVVNLTVDGTTRRMSWQSFDLTTLQN